MPVITSSKPTHTNPELKTGEVYLITGAHTSYTQHLGRVFTPLKAEGFIVYLSTPMIIGGYDEESIIELKQLQFVVTTLKA